ncbi:MAG: XRE family transcriptional regulator [Candidatus Moranbacteria bacterium]|nr:XRE family transcriptional regulator [Candidatus Moranbacteria bacterium]
MDSDVVMSSRNTCETSEQKCTTLSSDAAIFSIIQERGMSSIPLARSIELSNLTPLHQMDLARSVEIDTLMGCVSYSHLTPLQGVCQSREVIFVFNFDFRMKSIRKKRGYTQKFIAEKLNTTSQQISKYEMMVNHPSLERLVEIARILDVTLDELVVIKKMHSDYSEHLEKMFK